MATPRLATDPYWETLENEVHEVLHTNLQTLLDF